eukprot:CAMPEP_0195632802 /NCGR_PEP_ID=MMETSP0815-20121206/21793_1 /TAXON_ID=97485 /ORGANISM="Prymnesium parvum, Strain Texoma1" /LENGTH=93 /DNA_ID=CAMNT_0040774395 /DNA_START=512 /DNA_END=790 /DNA_ORIENTATION=-
MPHKRQPARSTPMAKGLKEPLAGVLLHIGLGSSPSVQIEHDGSPELKQRYNPEEQRKHLALAGQQKEVASSRPQQIPAVCLYAYAHDPPGAQH